MAKRVKPKAPSDLSEEAKAEWERVIEELAELDRLSKVDRAALTVYCRTWSVWNTAAKHVETNGSVQTYPNDYKGLSHEYTTMVQCANLLQKLQNDMGLTWKSRSKIAETKELPPLIYRKRKQ